MKKTFALFTLLFSTSTVFASHPHQAVCVAAGQYQDGSSVQFLLQLSSERTYENGDPNQDVHNYKFQARICDDDNDSGQCSTYQSTAVITSLSQKVKLVGMKDANKTLFEGAISDHSVKGQLMRTESKDGNWVKSMVPFEAKLTCISQTWVELKAEDDSNEFVTGQRKGII